ncbi:Alkyl hydroperoxide reductase subunit F [Anaerolineales bacterium]|nr:Alkyl hydroperoxide reductase subunit F [Anaerolineales bacterium]
MFDVIIAGGGIAGLSAALILGRARRHVVVCDTGKPRNAASSALHGFLSRDGIDPSELRRIGYEQLGLYPSVTCRRVEVVDGKGMKDGYEVTLEDGERLQGKYLLIATGIVDRLPPVPGIEEFYGRSVFHCPYCDGWENRDGKLAAYGAGTEGFEFALELLGWSSDVVLCTDGGEPPTPEQAARLERNGVPVITEPLARLHGEKGRLERIFFTSGDAIPCQALFFTPDQYQASPLAEKLGCRINEGVVETARFQQVHPRLFVVGDAARSVQLAIVAAAEAAEAAFAINTELLKEDLR